MKYYDDGEYLIVKSFMGLFMEKFRNERFIFYDFSDF